MESSLNNRYSKLQAILSSNFPAPTTRTTTPRKQEQEPVEPSLSSKNYMEMIFSYQVTWLVEDTAVDGAIFIFNPRSGQLFRKFIDAAKQAEEVAKLVSSLPPEEQPKQIIISNRMLIGPLHADLSQSSPNTEIKSSVVQLPFQSLLKIEKFRELINADQTHDVPFVFKVYDEWSKTKSSYSAFSRFFLVLRALDVNHEEAKRLLEAAEIRTNEPAHHIWPSLSDNEWRKVEGALRDLILSDYAHKNNVVDEWAFTQSEIIRDIILAGAHAEDNSTTT